MSNPYEPPLHNANRSRTTGPGAKVEGASPRKLAWYEQIWAALPLALIAVGGAIGGACGGAAWALNQKVFRSVGPPVLRYVVSGLVSILAIVLWVILAQIIASFIRG